MSDNELVYNPVGCAGHYAADATYVINSLDSRKVKPLTASETLFGQISMKKVHARQRWLRAQAPDILELSLPSNLQDQVFL